MPRAAAGAMSLSSRSPTISACSGAAPASVQGMAEQRRIGLVNALFLTEGDDLEALEPAQRGEVGAALGPLVGDQAQAVSAGRAARSARLAPTTGGDSAANSARISRSVVVPDRGARRFVEVVRHDTRQRPAIAGSRAGLALGQEVVVASGRAGPAGRPRRGGGSFGR